MSWKPRKALSRARILDAAIDVADADADGLGAISMRRVAAELGVEAMSLYHHISGKSALLDGIFERILDELPAPPPLSSWRDALRERAVAMRTLMRAHPHALPLFATRPAVTERSLDHVELTLGILREAGFSDAQALGGFQVVLAFVVGHSIAEFAPASTAEEAARPDYGDLGPERHPHVLAVLPLLARRDGEAEFHFGIDLLLDGLDACRHAPGRRP